MSTQQHLRSIKNSTATKANALPFQDKMPAEISWSSKVVSLLEWPLLSEERRHA